MKGSVSATLVVAVLVVSPLAAQGGDWREKVDSQLLDKMGTGTAEFLVFLREQADLTAARQLPGKNEKGRFVYERLRQMAEGSQGPLLEDLKARGVEHRAYWIANMIWVKGERTTLEAMAMREDVARVYANPAVRFAEPRPAAGGPSQPEAIEWNITKVRADQAWALGYKGLGAVVAGQDTGYQWDHPALRAKYRGWSGSAANHNYNWHDAIHVGSGGGCGLNSTQPCDDYGHGTHTMGTMVGDDGATNQVGMAPDAKWIGCRNMDVGNGTPATYSECFQFFLAPTDLTGANPNPALAPHAINNSWGCPPSEGCTDPNVLRTIVQNTRAAGIVPVVSAGNSGSGCSSVVDPASIYDASLTVGSTTSTDAASSFSSRGPVTIDGSNRLKPDIAAPGSGVRSSVPGSSYGSMSGTSMAGPHVAGLVALVISANPTLAGRVGQIERIIRRTAFTGITTVQTCGGTPTSQIPNNTFGYGRIDALAATQAAADWIFSDGFDPDI